MLVLSCYIDIEHVYLQWPYLSDDGIIFEFIFKLIFLCKYMCKSRQSYICNKFTSVYPLGNLFFFT